MENKALICIHTYLYVCMNICASVYCISWMLNYLMDLWFNYHIIVLLYVKMSEIIIDIFFRWCLKLCHFNILHSSSMLILQKYSWFYLFFLTRLYFLFLFFNNRSVHSICFMVIMMRFFLRVSKHTNLYICICICMHMHVCIRD